MSVVAALWMMPGSRTCPEHRRGLKWAVVQHSGVMCSPPGALFGVGKQWAKAIPPHARLEAAAWRSIQTLTFEAAAQGVDEEEGVGGGGAGVAGRT